MTTANTPTPDSGGPSVATFVTSGAASGAWTLDPAATTIDFHSTSIWGLAKVHGRFGEVSGAGSVAPDGTASGKITVDAASVDSKNKRRDEHLRSKDFFDVTGHPTITYDVRGISPLEGGRAQVQGVLTARGVSRPLEFAATVTEATADAVVIEAELTVDRSTFGMTWSPLKMATTQNRIVVHARFDRASG